MRTFFNVTVEILYKKTFLASLQNLVLLRSRLKALKQYAFLSQLISCLVLCLPIKLIDYYLLFCSYFSCLFYYGFVMNLAR